MQPQWKLQVVEVPITVTLAAYVAGDSVGGLLTSEAIEQVKGGCYVSWVRLIDAADQAEPYKLFLYDAAPTSITDADPFALVAADFNKLVTVIDIPAANIKQTYSALAWGFASGKDETTGEYHIFKTLAAGVIYGYLVPTATPDYAAVTDLTMHLGVMVM